MTSRDQYNKGMCARWCKMHTHDLKFHCLGSFSGVVTCFDSKSLRRHWRGPLAGYIQCGSSGWWSCMAVPRTRESCTTCRSICFCPSISWCVCLTIFSCANGSVPIIWGMRMSTKVLAVCWRRAKRSVERAGPCNCKPGPPMGFHMISPFGLCSTMLQLNTITSAPRKWLINPWSAKTSAAKTHLSTNSSTPAKSTVVTLLKPHKHQKKDSQIISVHQALRSPNVIHFKSESAVLLQQAYSVVSVHIKREEQRPCIHRTDLHRLEESYDGFIVKVPFKVLDRNFSSAIPILSTGTSRQMDWLSWKYGNWMQLIRLVAAVTSRWM